MMELVLQSGGTNVCMRGRQRAAGSGWRHLLWDDGKALPLGTVAVEGVFMHVDQAHYGLRFSAVPGSIRAT